MITRAAIARAPGARFEIVELRLEGPGPGEVLVEMKASAITASDEYARSGADPDSAFPALLGHEGAGVVVEIGAHVHSVRPGDHVIPLRPAPCRQCEWCLHPKTGLCRMGSSTRPEDGAIRFRTLEGEPILQAAGCAAFSNHIVLPESAVARVRGDAPFEAVCRIASETAAAIDATVDLARLAPGARCAVFGLGDAGLALIERLGAAGAARIVAVDPDPARREAAMAAGAAAFVRLDAGQDGGSGATAPLECGAAMGRGAADHVFEMSGAVDAIRAALDCARKAWGETIVIGLRDDQPATPTRLPCRLWRGAAMGGEAWRSDAPRLVDWWMCGKVDLGPIVACSLPIERINEGFDRIRDGEPGCAIVTY